MVTSTIISLFVAVLGGAFQLAIEYGIILPNIKPSRSNQEIVGAESQFPINETKSDTSRNDIILDPLVIRLLEFLFFSFSSTFVVASAGFEIGNITGLVFGILIGAIVSLVAIWAIFQWWKVIAIIFSYTAFVIILLLIFAGLITLVGKLMGISIGFSGGLFCVGIVVIIAFIGFIAWASENLR